MEGSKFDETEFFRAIAESGVRALLIGRRALVALGLPVLTADYDYWLHPADIEQFNAISSRFDLRPTHAPDAARARGRFALENDEHVDVMVSRYVTSIDGIEADFERIWRQRVELEVRPGVPVALPALEDLVLTKRFAARAKDAEDIRLLEALRERNDREGA